MRGSTSDYIASGCGFTVLGVGTVSGIGIYFYGLYNILKAGGVLAWIWGICISAVILGLARLAWTIWRATKVFEPQQLAAPHAPTTEGGAVTVKTLEKIYRVGRDGRLFVIEGEDVRPFDATRDDVSALESIAEQRMADAAHRKTRSNPETSAVP